MNIDNLSKAINQLENLDPKDEYAYERAVLAFISIEQLPILIYDLPEGTPVFRTRTHEGDDLFTQITDISFPPIGVIKNFARCNRPFQSVFYCSENRPTSCMELVEYWKESKKIGENYM